jgi:hypothetical protein
VATPLRYAGDALVLFRLVWGPERRRCPRTTQRSLRSRKLDRAASGSLQKPHAHMWCWELKAALHVVARAGAIHGNLNWANRRHSMHPPALDANTPCAPSCRGPSCRSYHLSQIHRYSFRRTATYAVVDGGWPRALDLVNATCRCHGSLAALVQLSLTLSRCMVASVH